MVARFRLAVVSNSRCVPNDRHSGAAPIFSACRRLTTSFAFSRVGEHAAERRNRMQSLLWESTHCESRRDIAGIFLLNVRAQLSFDTLFGRDRRKSVADASTNFLGERTFLLIQPPTRVHTNRRCVY